MKEEVLFYHLLVLHHSIESQLHLFINELQLLTLTIRRTRNNGSSVNIQVLYVDNQQFASNYTHQVTSSLQTGLQTARKISQFPLNVGSWDFIESGLKTRLLFRKFFFFTQRTYPCKNCFLNERYGGLLFKFNEPKFFRLLKFKMNNPLNNILPNPICSWIARFSQ